MCDEDAEQSGVNVNSSYRIFMSGMFLVVMYLVLAFFVEDAEQSRVNVLTRCCCMSMLIC